MIISRTKRNSQHTQAISDSKYNSGKKKCNIQSLTCLTLYLVRHYILIIFIYLFITSFIFVILFSWRSISVSIISVFPTFRFSVLVIFTPTEKNILLISSKKGRHKDSNSFILVWPSIFLAYWIPTNNYSILNLNEIEQNKRLLKTVLNQSINNSSF